MRELPAEPSRTVAKPRLVNSLVFGLLAAACLAIIYGLLDELIGLSWGLLVVGLVGGWFVGVSVAYGAWGEAEHLPARGLRIGALILGGVAWLGGLMVAFLISQAFIPRAATPLLERLTMSGFFDYLYGMFDFVRVIHALALALLAFMAWRAAR